MSGNDETIARIISKRAKNDPAGFASATKRGEIKGYFLTELKRVGISKEEFEQFLSKHSKDLGLPNSNLNVEKGARKAKEVVEESLSSLNLETISETLDELIFDKLYEKETQTSLDAQINEQLIRLKLNDAERIRHIQRKLNLPKCVATGTSVAFGAYALVAFLRGNVVVAIVQGLVAHDLSVAAQKQLLSCHIYIHSQAQEKCDISS